MTHPARLALVLTAVLGLAAPACGDGTREEPTALTAERRAVDDGAPDVATTTPSTLATTASTTTPPTTSGARPTPSTTAPAPSSRPDDGPSERGAGENDPATPAGAVATWMAALASGDTDAAWALTHVASQDAIGGRAEFERLAPDLAHRYGSWARTPDAEYEVTPLPAVGEAVSIVVVDATRGTEEPTAEVVAVPIRTDADGRNQVDPFQDLVGEAGLEHQPEGGAPIGSDHTFAVVLAGGRAVHLLVDDEVLTVTSESSDGDRQRVTGRTAAPLARGTHTFTVVIERDGAVDARAVTHRVEG